MKVRVKFFAILRERAGSAEIAKEIAEVLVSYAA